MRKWAEADYLEARRSISEIQKLTCRAFYWLPIRRMAILDRLQAKIRTSDACVVLDLEDGLWFPDNPVQTQACRAAARDELRRSVGLLRRHSGGMGLGVRVNPAATREFMLDLETLASIGVDWNCVFLPKVESASDYGRALSALSRLGICRRGLIPIVETPAGLRDIQNIAAAANEAEAGWIQYGHQDYSLGAGHWPFWEQDSPRFQALVEGIVAEAEDNGLSYIHTPYMHLRDREGFLAVQRWLNRICRSAHAQATLSWEQILAWRQHESARDAPSWRKVSALPAPITRASEPSAAALAEQVVAGYRLNLHSQRGFSVDAGTGRFFSPHEYLAASRFLAKDSHAGG